MTTEPPHSRQSALTDPEAKPVFLDVEEHGDALDDPDYRRMLGLDDGPGRR